MSLSPATARQPIHTRRIECSGYLRDDGLWDVDAHIVDTKTYPFENGWRGTVEPGSPVHDMHVRLTLDSRLVIHEAEAVTVDSPYRICPEAAPNLARIKGLRIKPGWFRDVKKVYGGREGCTHILELLRPMATTAFQTIFPYLERLRAEQGTGEETGRAVGPPIDSCYAYAADREVVQTYYPELYTGDGATRGDDADTGGRGRWTEGSGWK